MGFPKIPDSQEIAQMTADAMQPMMDELTKLTGLLTELVAVQNAIAAQQGVRVAKTKKVA